MVNRYDVYAGPRGETFKVDDSDGDSVDYTDYAALQASHDRLLGAIKNKMAGDSGGEKVCGHEFCCVCPGDMLRSAIAAAQPFTET